MKNQTFILFLLIISLQLISCKNKKGELVKTPDNKDSESVVTPQDSITISVKLEPKSATGFNLPDKHMRSYYLEFENPTEKDTIISKSIKRSSPNFTLSSDIVKRVDGRMIIFQNSYFAGNQTDSIVFNYKNRDVVLENNPKGLFSFYELANHIEYSTLIKTHKDLNQENLNRLDSVHRYFDEKFKRSNNKYANVLNDYYYLNRKISIDTTGQILNDFLTNLDTVIHGRLLKGILYQYWEKNAEDINPKSFTLNFSDPVNELLTVELYNFLSTEDNRGNKNFDSANAWLKTTDVYKDLDGYKDLEPLDNSKFKSVLSEISLTSTRGEEKNIESLIKDHSSNYYLIDFWATWCAPCIAGVKEMDKMDLPENVKVISLSLDKTKNYSKWKKITKKLKQEITYHMDDTKKENQTFLKLIELKSIPRYVLIDRNLNLIDQAFYHPQTPEFLPNLENIENKQNRLISLK